MLSSQKLKTPSRGHFSAWISSMLFMSHCVMLFFKIRHKPKNNCIRISLCSTLPLLNSANSLVISAPTTPICMSEILLVMTNLSTQKPDRIKAEGYLLKTVKSVEYYLISFAILHTYNIHIHWVSNPHTGSHTLLCSNHSPSSTKHFGSIAKLLIWFAWAVSKKMRQRDVCDHTLPRAECSELFLRR